MCGIVGCAGLLSIPAMNVFQDLLIMDQLRGFDSTGVCIVNREKVYGTLKGVVSPANLLASETYQNMVKTPTLVAMGHNRAATKGTIIKDNAHPFTHGHIVGMHNGTATSVTSLLDHTKFTVDSDNIFYHISKLGIKDLWTKYYGAATLAWWDDKEKVVKLIRNYQRPLYLGISTDNCVVYWASEKPMLECALARRNQKVNDIIEVTTNNIYTIKFNEAHHPIVETEVCPAYVERSFWDRGTYCDDDWGSLRGYETNKEREKSPQKSATEGSKKINWFYIHNNGDCKTCEHQAVLATKEPCLSCLEEIKKIESRKAGAGSNTPKIHDNTGNTAGNRPTGNRSTVTGNVSSGHSSVTVRGTVSRFRDSIRDELEKINEECFPLEWSIRNRSFVFPRMHCNFEYPF